MEKKVRELIREKVLLGSFALLNIGPSLSTGNSLSFLHFLFTLSSTSFFDPPLPSLIYFPFLHYLHYLPTTVSIYFPFLHFLL